MPEPCKFPSSDSFQMRCGWTHKEVDFEPHPVVGLALQGGDMEKFPHALGLESLNPFSSPQTLKQGPRFSAVEDGGSKRLVELELLLAKLLCCSTRSCCLAIAEVRGGDQFELPGNNLVQRWHLLSRSPHQDCLSNGSNSQTSSTTHSK